MLRNRWLPQGHRWANDFSRVFFANICSFAVAIILTDDGHVRINQRQYQA